MPDALFMEVHPVLEEATLVVAFEGWNDAGEAATAAVSFLTETVKTVPLAYIDPEEFYDFTVCRPTVRLEAAGVRRAEWPRNDFRFGRTESGRDLVTLVGVEPHLRWKRFLDLVLHVVEKVEISRVVLLGAYLADVLYSLPVQVSGFASSQGLIECMGVEPSGYEGPTGIVGVLADALAEKGLEVLSLWVALPHYVNLSPNPRGALALVQKLTQYLELPVDAEPLGRAAAEFEERISGLVASDPELSEYVRQLKRREFVQ